MVRSAKGASDTGASSGNATESSICCTVTLCGATPGEVAERLLLPCPLPRPLPTKIQDACVASLGDAGASSICCTVTLCGATADGVGERLPLP